MKHKINIKIYHGYGNSDSYFVFGHVMSGNPIPKRKYNKCLLYNILHLARLFMVKPIANQPVQLIWKDQKIDSVTESDGFFKFEWHSPIQELSGWQPLKINVLNEENQILANEIGKLYIPNATQFGFISDIDDTVLVSHSAQTGKKLRIMFTKNPRSRKTFADVVKFYNLLAVSHTTPDLLNPFFYVSSSEWNLYNDLNDFFKHNGLPKGIFLLSEMKRWFQVFKSGKTKHYGKLSRVFRVLDAFPNQKFVLLGDNSQADPAIYSEIVNKYPNRIIAIYIRNVLQKKEKIAIEILRNLDIPTCLFAHTEIAIKHAKEIGLID
ncbi:DUF2183 domain-containing protein [Lacihabitans sp. LS3-19]|uniref:App1 family protein n=1 Tax=Lacihabitans sp. LS3-19 TaxID=2487335 RepID=UPI0020CEF5DC|nr:phosphatase domain-containing protein [Lacihabitans sp. LS3-19]MCP9767042.1 DUF2183 domain-containing protein [Lacihabitans sp. LS3-19]